jgi:hypothetical protein
MISQYVMDPVPDSSLRAMTGLFHGVPFRSSTRKPQRKMTERTGIAAAESAIPICPLLWPLEPSAIAYLKDSRSRRALRGRCDPQRNRVRHLGTRSFA